MYTVYIIKYFGPGGVAASHLRGSQNNLAVPVHEEHTEGTQS